MDRIPFSGEACMAFAAVGFFATYWVYDRTNNFDLAFGLFFFFSLEVLQAVQYIYVAPELKSSADGFCGGSNAMKFYGEQYGCDSFENKLLTMLGFVHICFQPYFCHVMNASLTKNCKFKERYKIIKRLSLIAGVLLLLRYYFSFLPSLNTLDLRRNPSTEWLRGKYFCTFKRAGMRHLGWAIPLADPSYFAVGASLHGFFIFAPFIAMYEQKGMLLQGLLLFLSGPVLAFYLSNEVLEQPTIWSFFSVAQLVVALFVIREGLLVNRAKDNFTIFPKPLTEDEEIEQALEFNEDDFKCRYFIDCEYCNARRDASLLRRMKLLQVLYEEGKIEPLTMEEEEDEVDYYEEGEEEVRTKLHPVEGEGKKKRKKNKNKKNKSD